MAERAQEKTAIVTGGASGIGEATVALLHEKGWRVAIFDLDGKGLAAARDAYAGNANVAVLACDVTDEAAVEKAVAEVETGLGPIEGVVNCAGIVADKHVFETDAALMRKVLDVNVVGSFNVARAAAVHMAKRKRGAVVNLSSISALRGNKGRTAYGASKGAIVVMTQVMANDLAPYGIRVNAVAPGVTETAMVKAIYTQAERDLWSPYIPMQRFATPREIANVIAFLLDGEAAGYVTGSNYSVDGGFATAGVVRRDPIG